MRALMSKYHFFLNQELKKAAEEWQQNLEEKTEDLEKVNMRMTDQTEP